MIGITPKLPLSIDPSFPGGRTLINDYLTLIKQNFKNLLLTNPGERVMDPEFGIGLRTYLFESHTQSTFGNIRAKIGQQVDRYLSFIGILDVDIQESAEDVNGILVTITYEVLPLDSIDKVEITLPFN